MIVVDISEYQSISNPSTLKSRADGAILRLGYTGYGSKKPSLDKNFETFYKQCKDVGLPVGIYYFTIAFNQSMVDLEAAFIINAARTHTFELPIFIDIEAQKNSAGWTSLTRLDRTVLMRSLVNQLKAAGLNVGLYGSTVSTFQNMIDDSQFSDVLHWVAEYSTKCRYDKPMWGWQYTSSGDASSFGIKSGSNKLDLSEVYVALDSASKTEVPVTDKSSVATAMPKYGEKSDNVKWLQRILGVDVDGSFGPLTNQALFDYIIKTENLKEYLRVHI